jgi:hypothetical protein
LKNEVGVDFKDASQEWRGVYDQYEVKLENFQLFLRENKNEGYSTNEKKILEVAEFRTHINRKISNTQKHHPKIENRTDKIFFILNYKNFPTFWKIMFKNMNAKNTYVTEPMSWSKLFSPRSTSREDFREFCFLEDDKTPALSSNPTSGLSSSNQNEEITVNPFDIKVETETYPLIQFLCSICNLKISNWSTMLESQICFPSQK